MKTSLLFFSLFFSNTLFAQDNNGWERNEKQTATKKVLRLLDLNISPNKCLYKISDINGQTKDIGSIIVYSIINDRLKAYADINFSNQISIDSLNYFLSENVNNTSIKIDSFYLVECWMFDAATNKMNTSILALGFDAKNNLLEKKTHVSWIQFKDLIELFDNFYVEINEKAKISLNDYFEKRYFKSSILNVIKE